jgi:hypothetical protein
MKKKNVKKLALRKATLHNLGKKEMSGVNGGATQLLACITRFPVCASDAPSVCGDCFSELDCTTPTICPVEM